MISLLKNKLPSCQIWKWNRKRHFCVVGWRFVCLDWRGWRGILKAEISIKFSDLIWIYFLLIWILLLFKCLSHFYIFNLSVSFICVWFGIYISYTYLCGLCYSTISEFASLCCPSLFASPCIIIFCCSDSRGSLDFLFLQSQIWTQTTGRI